MMISVKTQENIAWILLGGLLLLITFVKAHIFYNYYAWTKLLYPVCIGLGFSLVSFFGFRLIGLKGRYGFLLLCIGETLLYFHFHIAASSQQGFLRLPWQGVVYSEMANIMQYDPTISKYIHTYIHTYKIISR